MYVITSELEFEVGGEDGLRFSAPAGSYIQKPRAIMHCFWNATDEPVLYIELSGREGFEGFVDSKQEGDLKSTRNAERDWGLVFHMDEIPRLMKTNNLTGLAMAESPDLSKLPDLPPKIAELIGKCTN